MKPPLNHHEITMKSPLNRTLPQILRNSQPGWAVSSCFPSHSQLIDVKGGKRRAELITMG